TEQVTLKLLTGDLLGCCTGLRQIIGGKESACVCYILRCRADTNGVFRSGGPDATLARHQGLLEEVCCRECVLPTCARAGDPTFRMAV
ncbi:hypothetical protein KC337_g1, partial [Hortaea werneckii]